MGLEWGHPPKMLVKSPKMYLGLKLLVIMNMTSSSSLCSFHANPQDDIQGGPLSGLDSLPAPTNDNVTIRQPRYPVWTRAPDLASDLSFGKNCCISECCSLLSVSFVPVSRVTRGVLEFGSKWEFQTRRPWSYRAGMLLHMMGFTSIFWATAQVMAIQDDVPGKLISLQDSSLQPQTWAIQLGYEGLLGYGGLFLLFLLCFLSESLHVVHKDQAVSPWSMVGLQTNCFSARLKWVRRHRMKFKFNR